MRNATFFTIIINMYCKQSLSFPESSSCISTFNWIGLKNTNRLPKIGWTASFCCVECWLVFICYLEIGYKRLNYGYLGDVWGVRKVSITLNFESPICFCIWSSICWRVWWTICFLLFPTSPLLLDSVY